MAWALDAIGAMVSASNTDVTPLSVSYPAGVSAGEILLMIVRNPTGSAILTNSDITTSLYSRSSNGQIELFGKVATGSESGSLTVSANNANRTIAQIARWSGGPSTLTGIVHTSANAGGSAATGLAYAGLTITQDDTLVLICGGKNVNVAGYTAPGDVPNEIGDGSGGTTISLTWDYAIQMVAADLTSGTWTISGDASAARSSISVALVAGTAVSTPAGRMLMMGVG